MPALPKISIVTPSLNQKMFLEEAILSVLDQKYPNLEYIIIDGGSEDGSVEIIKKYSQKLHYWISEKDEGHGHALNKGFLHTSGEIMAWINSDDKYLPWTFQVVVEIFSQFPHINWIVGFNSWWNDRGYMIPASRNPKNMYDYLLGNFAWIQQESVFWRRSLWEKAGSYINQKYKFMVDGELWSRFFLYDELYNVDCILSGYRLHSGNRAKLYMSDCQQEMKDLIQIMEKKCSREELQTVNALKTLKILKKYHLGWTFVYKRILKAIYKKIQYKTIVYRDMDWIETSFQFSI